MDYNGLVAAVADFLNRADAYSQIPTFIAFAEARMNRRLRVRRMVATATANIAAEYETPPTDFLAPMSMVVNPSASGSFPYTLANVSPDDINYDLGLQAGVAGQPKKYAVVGGAFHFSPIPDQGYTAYLNYYQALPALTSTNLTNWVLSTFPDAYLYGALVEAGLYLKADGAAVGIWSQRFESAVSEIEDADRRESYGARLTPTVSLVV